MKTTIVFKRKFILGSIQNSLLNIFYAPLSYEERTSYLKAIAIFELRNM